MSSVALKLETARNIIGEDISQFSAGHIICMIYFNITNVYYVYFICPTFRNKFYEQK